MRILGCALALFTGINTEYFAERGGVGIFCYVALIIISVLLVMRRSKNDRA